MWALGDIRGSIVAGRNVGRPVSGDPTFAFTASSDYAVFAYGDIDATIVALNSSHTATGGSIGAVAALGNISGRLLADRSVAFVRSAGGVTGQIVAPDLNAPAEFDPFLAHQFEVPETPDSIKTEIQSQLAEAADEVLADRAELDAAFAELAESNALLLQETRQSLDEARAETVAANAKVAAEAEAAAAKARAAAQEGLDADRQAAKANVDKLRAAIADKRIEIATEIAAVRAARDEAAQERESALATADAALEQLDAALTQQWYVVESMSMSQRAMHDRLFDEDDTDAEITAAFISGLGTGLKATGNAATDALIGFITLGFADPIHIFGGQDELGYSASYMFARGGSEILVGVGTGGISALSKAGWVVKAGKAAAVWDLAGNVGNAGQGIVGIVQNGLNWQNGMQAGTALLGIGAGLGVASVFRHADGVPAPTRSRTPYRDPQRPPYNNGKIHKDHIQARGLDGPDTPSNIQDLAAETNLRKGGHEGVLKRYEQYLRRNGMSPQDARRVIQDEIESLGKSPPPRPMDPNVLNRLPDNPLDQGYPY